LGGLKGISRRKGENNDPRVSLRKKSQKEESGGTRDPLKDWRENKNYVGGISPSHFHGAKDPQREEERVLP